MFEIIGIITVWFIGLFVTGALPLVVVAMNEKKLGERIIPGLIIAFWVSIGLCLTYIVATMAYLAIT